jgi:hypothetical protein
VTRARLALTMLAALLLAAGYARSQLAWFSGAAAGYARWIDQPPVQIAALALVVLATILALIPEPEEQTGQ